MAKLRMRKGSIVVALVLIRPWGPFRFGAVPKGARGKVLNVEVHLEPRLGAPDIRLVFAYVLFRWVDGKGKSRSATVFVETRHLRVLKY